LNSVKTQLSALGLRARKRLSQNFLQDPNWIRKIADIVTQGENEEIWEIGPGLGALTTALVKKDPPRFRAFELDPVLSEHIQKSFPQIEMVEGDFLKADLREMFGERKITLCGNLPYKISSQIVFKLLPHRSHFSQLVLMFQKEFSDRLTAKPRTSNYSALSVLIQNNFSVETIGTLAAHLFFPQPAIDSTLLLLKPKPEAEVPYAQYSPLVKTAFRHRRKKLSNNLKGLASREEISQIFERFGWNPNIRAEEVPPFEYLELAKSLI